MLQDHVSLPQAGKGCFKVSVVQLQWDAARPSITAKAENKMLQGRRRAAAMGRCNIKHHWCKPGHNVAKPTPSPLLLHRGAARPSIIAASREGMLQGQCRATAMGRCNARSRRQEGVLQRCCCCNKTLQDHISPPQARKGCCKVGIVLLQWDATMPSTTDTNLERMLKSRRRRHYCCNGTLQNQVSPPQA